MKTILRTFMISVMSLALLTPTPALTAETLTIPGTGDGTTVLKALAAAFSLQNPDIKVEVPKSIGSGGAVKGAGKDEFPLGRVARGIKAKEAHFNLSYLPYAKIPATFFVSKDVPISYLSSEQICDIYSGKTTNWKEVGGPDAAIKVVRREDGDSTLSVLRKSFPGFKDLKLVESAEIAPKTPVMFEIMTKSQNAIGFGPYDVAKNSPVNILKIDGRDPTFAGYPSVTTLGFVFKGENMKGAVKKFVAYALSKDANLPIIAAGGIPLQ